MNMDTAGANNNKYNGPERRQQDRRTSADRRTTIRFGDVLGRRSGVERRIGPREDTEGESFN